MKFKESESLELKKSTSELKEAIVSIAAILNKHQSGELYFGIRNDGTVIGQAVSEKTIREVSQSISEHIEPRIFPKVREEEISEKSCIAVAFEGSEAPYFAFGRAYIRVADENRQLSAKELEKIFLRKDKESSKWESRISERSIKDVSVKTVKEFMKKANETGRLSYKFDNAKNVLRKLGLTKGEKLLRAAEVLFCKNNPLEVQAAVFAGTDKVTFLDIQQFKGSLFFLLEKSEAYIKEHINWRAEISGIERQEIPEIPISAAREAIINSLCHRDYAEPKANEIAIFKNRVEIYNPGQFPEEYTPEDFIKGEERSILRNPFIANTLYLKSDIERWGSGLKRIYDSCTAAKVKVEFKKLKSGFLVVFHRKETAGTQKTTQKTTQKIMELIRLNPSITRKELAQQVGMTEDGIKYHLGILQRKNVIRRVGPDKGGHWEIRKE